MAIARHSLTQQQFDEEYQRINSKRNSHLAWLITFDVVNALSNAFVMFDMAPMLGLQVALPFAAGIGITGVIVSSATLLVILGLSGIYCWLCIDVVKSEAQERKKYELELQKECFDFAVKCKNKINEFKELLVKLLAIKEDSVIRSAYNKILKNENIDDAVKEVNGYIKHSMQENFPALVRQPRSHHEENADHAQDENPFKKKLPPNYKKFAAYMFFGGFFTALGIASSLAALVTLSFPILLGVLATAFVVAVAIGVFAAYFDYKARRSQQDEIETFENDAFSLFRDAKRLDKTMVRIDDYIVVLTQQKEIAELRNASSLRACSSRRSNPELIDEPLAMSPEIEKAPEGASLNEYRRQ